MTFPDRTIDIPESIFRTVETQFRQVPDTELFSGGWGTVLRYSGPRHLRWTAMLTMAPQYDDGVEDRRMTWDATVARMMGGFVAARLYHPMRIYPRGVGAGIYRPGRGKASLGGQHEIDGQYLIDGAYHIDGGSTIAYVGEDQARYSDSILMTGLWPSAVVFHAGDHFGLGGNLYMITDRCTSDANGECRVPFLWKLWKPALAGDRIDLHKPTARFVLANADEGAQSYGLVVGATSLSAVEIPNVD